ncbi:tRNA 2-thiouridine(34) synthase MnmA [bacterium]|nr:tRNA 2-thiouridine(34) synthase MnmA [bacterium]
MTPKTVILGISGGIDSSVAAYLLKEQGYRIIGVRFLTGGAERSTDRAEDICDRLDIKYRVLDKREEFQRSVLDYFIDEYSRGRTPNPCVVCNRLFKFKLLFDLLGEYDAGLIATGHYACVSTVDGIDLISKGKDTLKEQSYFLALLDEEIRKKIIFPLGDLRKNEVINIHKRNFSDLELPGESQDLCFLSDSHYSEMLTKQRPHLSKPGAFLLDGKKIGQHKGIIHYTVGQRKGLGLAHTSPLYVQMIDTKNNTVHVAEKNELYSMNIKLSSLMLHLPLAKVMKLPLKVKVRYRSKAISCDLEKVDDDFFLRLSSPLVITPGQLAVIYSGKTVIGAGWEESEH